ncbi:MAG: acyl--CoA ligase, partial [Acidobacteria bacterium]|nr:acyl--CoA ligase [Acidobacteriota bacterium]
MNAAGLVSQAAREYPELLALEYYGESWTFRELLEQVESLGESLRRWGIASGDRVGIWLGDSPQTLFMYLAVLQADATALVFDPQWRLEQIARVLAAPLDVLVYRSEYFPLLQQALGRGPEVRLLVEWDDAGSFKVQSRSRVEGE